MKAAVLAAPRGAGTPYALRLYVTGMTQRSLEAIQNIRAICREDLHGRCALEIIDIYDDPARAVADQIVAIPTLIKSGPGGQRRFVGNLADRRAVLAGLD